MTKRIDEVMQDTPANLISGPRQAGKTTLARRIAGQEMRYLSLDDETVLLAAKWGKGVRKRGQACFWLFCSTHEISI